jgi:hypothetical protein
MSKKIALLLTLCLCLNVSCEKNKYKIVLTPQGDSIKREVTCWREGDNNKILEFPQSQLDQISQAYNVPSPKAGAKKYSFAGTFTEQTPNDIGGAGSYLYATTSMGDSFFYSERFRGNDDLQMGLNQRRKAVNELVDIIIGWFQSEMRWEWNFGKLKNFLDRDFRWDMQNICLYGWSAGLTGKDKEMGYRSVQYLSERNYFDTRESLEAINELGWHENYDMFIPIIRRIVAEKMGYDPEKNLPKSFTFLATTDSVRQSLEKYLKTSKQYKALLEAARKRKKVEPNLRDPEPLDTMGDLFSRAMGGPGFDIILEDDLEVVLTCPVEPYHTNGKWNEEKQILECSQVIEQSQSQLPTYMFAAWSVPNEAFQKAHFGKIVLEGEALGHYIFWQNSLSDTQKKEWNTFLESLTPDSGLKKQLTTQFKYPSGTEPGPENPGQWVSHFAKVLYENGKPSGVTATMPTTQSTQSTQ